MNYNINKLAEQHKMLHASLNTNQLLIYDKVISSVHDDKGGIFFVYGAGGTGKTFLYQAIIARLRSEKHIVLAEASSSTLNSSIIYNYIIYTYPIIEYEQ